jgi:hypothetical protein
MESKIVEELSEAFRNNRLHVDDLIMEKLGIPEYPNLFHYTSIEGMKSIISNNNIWATDYRFLNDAQEMSDGLDILMKVLKSSVHPALSGFIEVMNIDELVKNDYLNPYILSFCSTNDLLSQWRAYGGESEGVCLEFDLFTSYLSAKKNSPTSNGYLVPVVYDDLIKESVLADIMKSIEDDLLSAGLCNESYKDIPIGDQNYITGMIASKFMTAILSFKNKSYKEEDEWRAIFFPNKDDIESLRKFRTSNGTFTPYIEVNTFDNTFQCTLLPIKSVCLPPASGNSLGIGLDLFLKSKGYKEDNAVNINCSSIPLRSKSAIYW